MPRIDDTGEILVAAEHRQAGRQAILPVARKCLSQHHLQIQVSSFDSPWCPWRGFRFSTHKGRREWFPRPMVRVCPSTPAGCGGLAAQGLRFLAAGVGIVSPRPILARPPCPNRMLGPLTPSGETLPPVHRSARGRLGANPAKTLWRSSTTRKLEGMSYGCVLRLGNASILRSQPSHTSIRIRSVR